MRYTYTDAAAVEQHQHEQERRQRNRAQFFERRERAAMQQVRTHFRIENRVAHPVAFMAIEQATVRHYWSWQRR